jgi:hypothetical protein
VENPIEPQLDPRVRDDYEGQVGRHPPPFFSLMKIGDIMAEHCCAEGRATAPSPGHSTPAKTLILNAVSTTPSGGEVVSTHPSRG